MPHQLGTQGRSWSSLLQVLANMEALSLTPPKLTARIQGMREVTLGVFPTYFPFSGMETTSDSRPNPLHRIGRFPTYFPFSGMETLPPQ